MIFLRQKQFNAPRIVISHRSRSRNHIHRHLQHQQIIRQNAVDLSSDNISSTRRSNLPRTQNEEIVRSVALNEKLASIGGLFGKLSIFWGRIYNYLKPLRYVCKLQLKY